MLMEKEEDKAELRLSPQLKLSDDRVHLSLYKDGDMLTGKQAAEVVSENSGYKVKITYMSDLIGIGRIKNHKKFGRNYMYPYSEVKNLVVSQDNSGRPRKPDEEITQSARNMRQYRERLRAGLVVPRKKKE